MLHTILRKTVGICESQPATAEGVRSALQPSQRLEVCWIASSLTIALELLCSQPVEILLLDKGFGIHPILELLQGAPAPAPAGVVWGVSMTEAEALRILQSGAKGILRKTADLSVVVAGLEAVAAGSTWMEECVFRESGPIGHTSRYELTSREQQVLELVERGLKNREIAHELGIRPGTVKIHLKHIFEKTGVRGRYGLALNGMRQKNGISLVAIEHAAC
jgi:two-component system nitrate/nitrite response regulator NarL